MGGLANITLAFTIDYPQCRPGVFIRLHFGEFLSSFMSVGLHGLITQAKPPCFCLRARKASPSTWLFITLAEDYIAIRTTSLSTSRRVPCSAHSETCLPPRLDKHSLNCTRSALRTPLQDCKRTRSSAPARHCAHACQILSSPA